MTVNITAPTLLIDKNKVLKNISRMAAKAKANQIELRPHFKTHQSHEVGRWFKDFGVRRITVSSIRMAQYFAKDGWDDITIAFPINIRELQRLSLISLDTQVNILVENIESLEVVSKFKLGRSLGIFIKVDVGYHRTGLQFGQADKVDQIIEYANNFPQFKFLGFLGHAGHSYSKRNLDDIMKVHESSSRVMNQFRERYLSTFPDLTISYGDTPTCSLMDGFPGIDEIRPGNFVFYDVTQWTIGSCQLENIGVAMACPIVAIHEDRSEIIVYGGGIHFSKDRIQSSEEATSYGMVVPFRGTFWENNPFYGFVKSLSQEHGIVKASPALMKDAKIGGLLYVLPIHSCMAANLMKHYYTLDGHHISMMKYH